MKRHRINIRLTDDMWFRLQTEARSHEATMTAIIETALAQYFEPEKVEARENALLSRMDRFDARQGQIEADVRLCTETLGQYVLYWLTRTEPIPEGERDAAHALGQRRFDHFIGQVAKKLSHDRGVLARLLATSDSGLVSSSEDK